MLFPENQAMEIRNQGQTASIHNLTSSPIASLEEALETLQLAERNRIVASTNLNEQSSRSHMVTIITIEREHKDKESTFPKKNLNLKDVNIADYEKYLSLKLGYKVEIKDKEGKGYLLVRYKNIEQLDAIVDLFNN